MITQLHCLLLLTVIVSSYSERLPDFRLPPNVVPHHYDLHIKTHLELDNFSFQGMVSIKVECLKPTDTIKIHASKNLKITSNLVSVESASTVGPSKSLRVADTHFDEKNEFFVVRTTEKLVAGLHYNMSLSFNGQLTEDNSGGYYRSSYLDSGSNSTKWLAVTHFEPTFARKAFPCFDEPAMKATFTIQLAIQNKYVAVSNMPLKTTKTSHWPGWVWYEFEPSVLMSTYHIAYMVSEFEARQSKPQPHSPVRFRIWASHDAASRTVFASHVAPHFLSYYENVLGVKYPLPKIDLVALPNLRIGGMENWGLVTFWERFLLVDETVSEEEREFYTKLIAHELAHMWFGNLVTMSWWNDVWLKEGFATYMANVCLQHEFPEWLSLDTHFMTSLTNIFETDADSYSRPISSVIGNAQEIDLMFDDISYIKGSLLVRMMNLFLGEEVFHKGITQYLMKHKFSNVHQDDLWTSLNGQAHRYHVLPHTLTVKEIMDTWTLQAGYPLITVSRNYNTHKINISQKRYLAVKSDKEEDYKGAWWVPLSYSTAKEPHFHQTHPQHWLPSGKTSIELDIPVDKGDWLILNNRAAGLYRVNYDSTNWALIADTLNSNQHNEVDLINRAQLITDAMDFAEQGDLSFHLAFRILSCLRFETQSLLLWQTGVDKLESIDRKLKRTQAYANFKKFVSSLMTPIIKKIGKMTSKPTTYEGRRLLAFLTPWACRLNVSGYSTEASDLFSLWQKSSNPDTDNPIQNNLREVVYTEAIRQGGKGAWNFLWERYKKAGATDQYIILTALAATKDIWLLNRYLDWTLDESHIEMEYALTIFSEIAKQDIGFSIAKRFFFKNFRNISEHFGESSHYAVNEYFTSLIEQVIQPRELEELMEFAEKHVELGSAGASQARTVSRVNLDWMRRHYDNVAASLGQLQ